MTKFHYTLRLGILICLFTNIVGCDSSSNLGSSQSLDESSSSAFQMPSLNFGKSDQTQTAELKSPLIFTQSYPDVAEKAHVFPIELKSGDRIKVYAWTDQLAMVLMFGSDQQDQHWKNEEWRQATNDLKPGLAKQEIEFQAQKTGRHVVVIAPYQSPVEYLLNVQCISGSCLSINNEQLEN